MSKDRHVQPQFKSNSPANSHHCLHWLNLLMHHHLLLPSGQVTPVLCCVALVELPTA
jgi:hypothetical protein